MRIEIGEQYYLDDPFMASARLHQSRYRLETLRVDCDIYGNMLKDSDAKDLLNYYGRLGVREELRKRYQKYSKIRDANMLRSEHIPFNMFAPLMGRLDLAKQIMQKAFGVQLEKVTDIKIEYAPEPKEFYLYDGTSFDVYVNYLNSQGKISGLGIEVKYTEHEYAVGLREKGNIENKKSKYWELTDSSGQFVDESKDYLACDKMRQIWRNHLLGLAMKQRNDLSEFTSITMHPSGNLHFTKAILEYHSLMKPEFRKTVIGCTFEKYIDAINGDVKILDWKKYLFERYIVGETNG